MFIYVYNFEGKSVNYFHWVIRGPWSKAREELLSLFFLSIVYMLSHDLANSLPSSLATPVGNLCNNNAELPLLWYFFLHYLCSCCILCLLAFWFIKQSSSFRIGLKCQLLHNIFSKLLSSTFFLCMSPEIIERTFYVLNL